jgi:predicted O-methyltransferase YrrM
MDAAGSRFGDAWDRYVASFDARKAAFAAREGRPIAVPGDEWGHPAAWRRRTGLLFEGLAGRSGMVAMEIGPGSGKYTRLFLEAFPDSRVIACDVSAKFLGVLKRENHEAIDSGRIVPELLDPQMDCLDRVAARHGIVGRIDCLFSIDSMVHVGLQYLVAYWQSASRLLKTDGLMIMGVADATTEQGFQKLVRDVPSYFSKQGAGAFGQFEWLSADLVRITLHRLGFVVDFIPQASERDCYFVARVVMESGAAAPPASSRQPSSG